MLPNDTQLKQALAKMLPENVHMANHPDAEMWWMEDGHKMTKVLDTELLHLCWLVEETLSPGQRAQCASNIYTQLKDTSLYCVPHYDYHATWQQRVVALCKVKGITL